MYKLILGIVTIGVLQFALMMYLQTQEPAEKQVAQLRPSAEPVRPVIEFDDSGVAEVTSVPESISSDEPTGSRIAERRHFRGWKRHLSRADRSDPVRPAPDAEFETVVISYNVPPAKPECGSQEPDTKNGGARSQFAEAKFPRWKVVKTDTLSFE
jgi:hypothetical protein